MTDRLTLKKQLADQCHQLIARRIDEASAAIAQLRASAAEETKSSAGDKYETAREMINQEIEKLAMQVEEARRQSATLSAMDLSLKGVALPGAVIETDRGAFFLSISIPSLTLGGNTYTPISTNSPLGLKLSGRKPGEEITVNQRSYKILSVY
jgi:hypothetical protein